MYPELLIASSDFGCFGQREKRLFYGITFLFVVCEIVKQKSILFSC